jgi:tRNA (guanine6-N2)-methyltransferase
VKRFVLRSLAGLEPVVAAEVLLRLDRVAEQIGARELVLSVPDDEAAAVASIVVRLSTVDDAFLEVVAAGPVGRTMADLEVIADLARGARHDASAELVLGWRQGTTSRSGLLDVTASVLGRQRYSRFDVEDLVGSILSPVGGAVYRSRSEGASGIIPTLSYRVTVDKRRTALLLRLAAQPLHRRPYWRESRPGALHPPLAAAMAMLAELGTAAVVLDPFCGSGTIAIETARLAEGSRAVVASDIDAEAVRVTRRNAREGARVRVQTVCCDTGALPFRRGSIDRVISNPPWDHQVSWSRCRRSGGSFNEVLAEEFRIVLLELEGQAAKALGAGWHPLGSLQVSLRGQHPVVTVYGSAPGAVMVSIGDRRVPLGLPVP